MLRKNENQIKDIRNELRIKEKTNYKGFLIIPCQDNFGEIYYTLVNTQTQGHVHARSLTLAMQICDVGRHLFYNPSYQMKGYSKDIMVRASKLIYREVKKYH